MAFISVLGVAGVAAGIFLIRAGQPGSASVAAFAPTVILATIFVIMIIKGSS